MITWQFGNHVPPESDRRPPSASQPVSVDSIAFEERHMDSFAQQVYRKIWPTGGPYHDFPARLYETDLQGWNFEHHFLSDTITKIRPKIVVEVGVWKGASTVYMARTIRNLGLDSVVIAVDTWLGSWEHWLQPQWFSELCFRNGHPQLYLKFISNLIANEVAGVVVPLPLDSNNALRVINAHLPSIDMLHIDAAHDYDAVSGDLKKWWELVRPGGTVICDDYVDDGGAWPDVKRAVDDFRSACATVDFQSSQGKCQFWKP